MVPGYYHGTGDVFASVVISALMNGLDLMRANEIAVLFTAESVMRTKIAGTEIRFGVNFEEGLGRLIGMVKEVRK
jgi:pyridoxine kinase